MKKQKKIKSAGDQLKHWTLKQFLHYLWLRIRMLLGFKTFRVKHTTICTTGGIITVGNEYQFKEGCHLHRMIIESIVFKERFIYVKVNFFDLNRKVRVSHVLNNISYMGIWRIYDKGYYDIEEWYADDEPIDQALIDSLPIITIP